MEKEERSEWLDENSYKAKMLTLLPLRPGFGFYITVEDLEISEDFFKEEYDLISDAYYSVLDKMGKHYDYINSKKGKLNKKIKKLK